MTLREGNREYYYHMLGRWFPGLKARYVSHFGSSYACKSPNNEGLSVPKIDLVVAIASKIISKPLDRWPLIEKCIIPALGD